jgi:hypothetical protein
MKTKQNDMVSTHFFEGYYTECMMLDYSLEVSSHSTSISGNDRADSPISRLDFT